MSALIDTLTKPKIEQKTNLKEPSKYRVIYINDNVTTAEFVVETLINIFDMEQTTAIEIMQKVHTEGSAVVAVLPYEIAEQKGIEVTMLARSHGFPLQIRLESE
jgi:ATP-dependent Clp protease adaptor protein ClpS